MHVVLEKPRYEAVQSPLASDAESRRSVGCFLTVHHYSKNQTRLSSRLQKKHWAGGGGKGEGEKGRGLLEKVTGGTFLALTKLTASYCSCCFLGNCCTKTSKVFRWSSF